MNGLHKEGLSKNHSAKVINLPGDTSETIFEDTDDIIKSMPDCLDVHAETNDLTRGRNLLNQTKKIAKQVEKVSQNTKIVFSSIVIWKDQKNIDRMVFDINSHLKNYCRQKNSDSIGNNKIKEDHLDLKKLHLNKESNSAVVNNFLTFL